MIGAVYISTNLLILCGYKAFWELDNHLNDCPIFIKSIFT